MINLVTKEQRVSIKKMFFALYQGSQTCFFALTRVSNTNFSEDQMKTYKVTLGPHYDHQMVVDANVLQCLVRC